MADISAGVKAVERARPRRHVKLLIMAMSAMLLLVAGVWALTRLTGLGFGLRTVRSGTFEDVSQEVLDGGFSLSALRANGHNTVYANLTAGDLRAFSLESSISGGGMFVTVSGGGASREVDLTGGSVRLSGGDIGIDSLRAGRILIDLGFINAEGVDVTVKWK